MPYVKPEEVTSPKAHWTLIGVLRDGGAGKAAYAVGKWDDEVRIACRWNGWDEMPAGNPQSRGRPTWMILEPEAAAGVVNGLDLTDALLELVAKQHDRLDRNQVRVARGVNASSGRCGDSGAGDRR